MKKYTKKYMDAFGYGLEDFIPCEATGCRANDIHHIENRGFGSSKNKDRIENLMAVDRQYHFKYGDDPKYMDKLFEIHRDFMEVNGVKYDKEYIEQKIKFYKTINE